MVEQRFEIGSKTHWVKFTSVKEGNFQIDSDPVALRARQQAIVQAPWTYLRQVHGTHVVVSGQGTGLVGEGDGLISTKPGRPISVTTADCAPVVLIAEEAQAVVHAGWRGLIGGVIGNAASKLAELGHRVENVVLGPHISAPCYEFSELDLQEATLIFGDEIRSMTDEGKPAFDLYSGIALACELANIPVPEVAPCTSDTNWFSHRLRSDQARQAAVAWYE